MEKNLVWKFRSNLFLKNNLTEKSFWMFLKTILWFFSAIAELERVKRESKSKPKKLVTITRNQRKGIVKNCSCKRKPLLLSYLNIFSTKKNGKNEKILGKCLLTSLSATWMFLRELFVSEKFSRTIDRTLGLTAVLVCRLFMSSWVYSFFLQKNAKPLKLLRKHVRDAEASR